MPPRVATYYPTSSYSLPWPAAACHRPPPRAYVENKAVMSGEPVMPANWQRLAEAGGRPELDLALSGRAGGRTGRGLWAAVFHIASSSGQTSTLRPQRKACSPALEVCSAVACAAYAGCVKSGATGGASQACIRWCITRVVHHMRGASQPSANVATSCVCGAASGHLCCVRSGEARADAQPVARERPAHEAPFARTECHEQWRQSERLQYVNTSQYSRPERRERLTGRGWPKLRAV